MLESHHINISVTSCCGVEKSPELQIRGSIKDNSKIIFLISQGKHML